MKNITQSKVNHNKCFRCLEWSERNQVMAVLAENTSSQDDRRREQVALAGHREALGRDCHRQACQPAGLCKGSCNWRRSEGGGSNLVEDEAVKVD